MAGPCSDQNPDNLESSWHTLEATIRRNQTLEAGGVGPISGVREGQHDDGRSGQSRGRSSAHLAPTALPAKATWCSGKAADGMTPAATAVLARATWSSARPARRRSIWTISPAASASTASTPMTASRIDGIDAGDESGRSEPETAMPGRPESDPGGVESAGESYVVFSGCRSVPLTGYAAATATRRAPPSASAVTAATEARQTRGSGRLRRWRRFSEFGFHGLSSMRPAFSTSASASCLTISSPIALSRPRLESGWNAGLADGSGSA